MKMKGLLYLSVVLLLQALCQIASAQSIRTSGKITSKLTNEALPGASVMVKGSNTATLTDNQGGFSLTVPQRGATLVITFLGYNTQEVVVKDASPLTITMVQGAGGDLNEVVVVGYGVQKKSVVTGAISSVKAADLDNQPLTRVEQALQGRTSGLTISSNSGQPGSASTVRLRGVTSFGTGKNDPLWVIDGVVLIMEGSAF